MAPKAKAKGKAKAKVKAKATLPRTVGFARGQTPPTPAQVAALAGIAGAGKGVEPKQLAPKATPRLSKKMATRLAIEKMRTGKDIHDAVEKEEAKLNLR